MASKRKAKKYQAEVEGRIIDLQRFAYDVFVFSALKFRIPQCCIPRWEGKENDYAHSDFILVLSRVFLKYQISQRQLSYSMFKSRFESSNFDSFENIQNLLNQILKLSISNANGYVLHELLLVLSVISEMIIFLYSKNCNLYLKELARFWYQYVSPWRKNIEKEGGLGELYRQNSRPKYDSVDVFYNRFIEEFSFPYDDPLVLECLEDLFHAKSRNYFLQLSEHLPEMEKFRYYIIMHKTVWLHSMKAVLSIEAMNLMCSEYSERDEASETDLPVNTGLGIPQHEELLRNVGIPIANDATLPQDLPGPSRQVPARERKRSTREKIERRKCSSRQSVEEDIRQLDLGSSKEKSPSQEKK